MERANPGRWHHGHGLLPKMDAPSEADGAGPPFRLGSPERLANAAAVRTEHMLVSKSLS